MLVSDDGSSDAWDALGGGGTSVRELLAADRMDDLAGATENAQSIPPSEVRLLPPVPDPEKILCIGLNYRSHAEETKQEIPDVPDSVREVP